MAVKLCDTEAEKSSEANQLANKVSEPKEEKPSVPDQQKKQKFQVHFIAERCKGCTYCIEFCPKGVLKISDRINSKGYYLPVAVSPEDCIGCKLCELICPDLAVFVEKISEEKEEKKQKE